MADVTEESATPAVTTSASASTILGGAIVLGLDHWYTAFGVLDILNASTVLPLVGVYDADPERRAEMVKRYPNIAVEADAGPLMSREGVALAAICTSTDQAPELARRALDAGLHVVCVKPSARTLSELDDVLAHAEQAGRFFGSFEGMQRLHPRAILARDLIRAGAIGTPLSFHQLGHGGLPAPWPGRTGDPKQGGDSWWLHSEKVPGGAWIDHAIYAVDLARFVLDADASPVEVIGSTIENRVAPDLPLEDYGIALMRIQPQSSGESAAPPVTLVIEDTWAAQSGGGAHRTEFLGTAGTLRLQGNDWVVTAGGTETRHPILNGTPFFPFDDLATILLRGENPPFGPANSRANLAACLTVYTPTANH